MDMKILENSYEEMEGSTQENVLIKDSNVTSAQNNKKSTIILIITKTPGT